MELVTRVMINPDEKLVSQIRQKLKDNDGYCPCQLIKNEDTKCPCKKFKEQIENGECGECHCGLFVLKLEQSK